MQTSLSQFRISVEIRNQGVPFSVPIDTERGSVRGNHSLRAEVGYRLGLI